jgi:hypothetical protein
MPVNRGAIIKIAKDLHKDRVDIADDIKSSANREIDPTPPAERYVRPGYVQVEWLGDRGPLAEFKLRLAANMGMFPRDLLQALEDTTETLLWTTKIPYVMRRDKTIEHDGMSEDYSWGPNPGTYVREVKMADADKILSSPSGYEFLVLDWPRPQPCDFDPIDRFIIEPMKIAKREEEGKAIAARLRAMEVRETTQALTGVAPGPEPGPGSWTSTR